MNESKINCLAKKISTITDVIERLKTENDFLRKKNGSTGTRACRAC